MCWVLLFRTHPHKEVQQHKTSLVDQNWQPPGFGSYQYRAATNTHNDNAAYEPTGTRPSLSSAENGISTAYAHHHKASTRLKAQNKPRHPPIQPNQQPPWQLPRQEHPTQYQPITIRQSDPCPFCTHAPDIEARNNKHARRHYNSTGKKQDETLPRTYLLIKKPGLPCAGSAGSPPFFVKVRGGGSLGTRSQGPSSSTKPPVANTIQQVSPEHKKRTKEHVISFLLQFL